MARFKMDKSIAADIKSVADSSFKDNIRMIEIDKLKPSLDNFFSLTEIDILADDIERQGLKHNIVVTEDTNNPGSYFIKSGHRRFKAICQLIEQERYNSKYVPCFVDGSKSQSENLLDLIMLNATTRVMSDSELYNQYEVLKDTLDKLKDEGKKVKGRFREIAANYLNVSPAQVGKIENIKHNAVDQIKSAVEDGTLSITVADSVASLNEDDQKELISEKSIAEIKTSDAKEKKKKSAQKEKIKEDQDKDLSVKRENKSSANNDDNIDLDIKLQSDKDKVNVDETENNQNQVNNIISDVIPLWSKVLASSDSISLKDNIIDLKNKLNEIMEGL